MFTKSNEGKDRKNEEGLPAPLGIQKHKPAQY